VAVVAVQALLALMVLMQPLHRWVVLERHQKFLALVLCMQMVAMVESLELLVRLAQQILETVAVAVAMVLAHQRLAVQAL
jgi:hypothetical protein